MSTFPFLRCFLLFFPESRKDYRPSMKRIFILFAVIAAVSDSRADLVMQQQITTANYNGVATIKIKGAKVRLDMYAGQPQALSTITDLNTGEAITLMHNQKMFLKSAGQPMKQNKPTDAVSSAPAPRPTGQTQKVGGYDTELYTWSNPRGITGTIWVAKNYPDFARIRADFATLDKTTGADNDATPALSTLPGMMVRSQVAGGGQTIIMALISAKETPLDASLFVIPSNYKEVPRPKPLKQVGAPPVTKKPVTSPAPKTSGTVSTNSTRKLPSQ
jgi:hypothetical protein